MAFTSPFTAVTGAVITANGWNTSARDNIIHFRGLLPDPGAANLALISSGATAAAWGLIQSANIADGACIATKIPAGAINEERLADRAVTNGKIALATILAENIANGQILDQHIADGEVTNTKLADPKLSTSGGTLGGNVTFANNVGLYGDNSGGGDYQLARVTSGNRVQLGEATAPTDVQGTAATSTIFGRLIANSAGNVPVVGASGRVHDSDKVEGQSLANLDARFAPFTVPTANLGNLAVTTAKMADLNVTEGKLAAGAVTLTKLGAGAGKLTSGSYTGTGASNPVATGFQPSLVIVHTDAASGSWWLFDGSSRGLNIGPGLTPAEATSVCTLTATGFTLTATGGPNASGQAYRYTAIG